LPFRDSGWEIAMDNTLDKLRGPGLFAARVLLALIFVVSGYEKISAFAASAAYMKSAGMPIAEVFLVPAILIELGGGLLLVFGYKTRLIALTLFFFLIPTTLIFHAFWSGPPDQAPMQAIQFQKNLAIMGGMLFVFFCGPGRWSLDQE
jgi:putative oxidoreductase